MSLYGTTKRAVRYFTRSIALELRATGVSIGLLSPGMVVTDLLLDPVLRDREVWQKARKIYNVLADRVATVAPFLARRILAGPKNGARIAWLTPAKALIRFLVAPFRRRVAMDEESLSSPGEQRMPRHQ
jgi:NAD(P)-dependent dehydrogenase (short-subunit alcohol dehydrogenase family)